MKTTIPRSQEPSAKSHVAHEIERPPKDRWSGLRAEARRQLQERDYRPLSFVSILTTGVGIDADELIHSRAEVEARGAWIPGVELFERRVYPQRFRGLFSELGRSGEGVLGAIGLWPQQWATAQMFGGTAKGFHIHPPFIPEGWDPAAWFRSLFVEVQDGSRRAYDREQWDIMYLLAGRLRMVLIDERAGLERRVMEFFLKGDDACGRANVGVVIPPGVAHGLQVEGVENVVMVYGTSTAFDPAAEGRIAAEVEAPPFPVEWESYRRSTS